MNRNTLNLELYKNTKNLELFRNTKNSELFSLRKYCLVSIVDADHDEVCSLITE